LIILIGIGINCFITVFLLCSLHGADLPLALCHGHFQYEETSTSSSTITSTPTTQLMLWVPSLSPQDSSDSLEVRRLLRCDHTNWGECVRAASKLANNQAVFAQQFATHGGQALQRALSGPTEYAGIKLFPQQHPVTVPLDPRFQPTQEWDKNRAFQISRRCGAIR
jgi:hypothetical protein